MITYTGETSHDELFSRNKILTREVSDDPRAGQCEARGLNLQVKERCLALSVKLIKVDD